MVGVSKDFVNKINSLKDPEVADSWEEFVHFVKNFRSHMFLGSIAVTGVGIFTLVYGITQTEGKTQLPITIAGLITTILGTGMTVDMASHLYYG